MAASAWSGGVDSCTVGEPSCCIRKPLRQLTIAEIDKASNVELRRLMIELYGHSRYLMETGAELVDEDEFGQLYRKEIPNDEAIVMLCVTNSTMEPDGTYKKYFLRVPPSVRTARQAVAWTFSMQPNDYAMNPSNRSPWTMKEMYER